MRAATAAPERSLCVSPTPAVGARSRGAAAQDRPPAGRGSSVEAHSLSASAPPVILGPVFEGRVHRHSSRGASSFSAKDAKRSEDEACQAGLRNPASLLATWPQLWHAMAPVGVALLQARQLHPECQDLYRTLGGSPEGNPPAAAVVEEVRECVGRAIGLPPGQAQLRHAACPWRHEIVRQIQRSSGDPDMPLAVWLRDGCPMGITTPIEPGGLFPGCLTEASVSIDDIAEADTCSSNHASFFDSHGEYQPPGISALEEYLDAGFGELFRDRQHAEVHLGCRMYPSPLGNISKTRPDGSRKDRIIQDMKLSRVNLASTVPERQVLPTFVHHAVDLATLSADSGDDEVIDTLVLDFRSAFMSLALAERERPFNCADIGVQIRRRRLPLFDGEVSRGSFVVWRVLGFGGRPNPVVFARASSFASRTAQALFRPSKASRLGLTACSSVRGQTYVDDPCFSFCGSAIQNSLSVDILILWWLVLGVPLAFTKGAIHRGAHVWIGARVNLAEPGVATVELPEPFLADLYQVLAPLARGRGTVPVRVARAAVGKCARVAHLVPDTLPFASSMWGALAAALGAAAKPGRAESPPGFVACRRFKHAASWFRALIKIGGEPLLPLIRRVYARKRSDLPVSDFVIKFDASPWGAGAVLFQSEAPREFIVMNWDDAVCKILGAGRGDSQWQTLWEYVAMLVALMVWGDRFTSAAVTLAGDNVAALEGALNLRGKRSLTMVTRELAWRRVRGRWCYQVAHVPAEHNVLADTLSRMGAPHPAEFPYELSVPTVVQKQAPCLATLWVAS